jgi:hypothetical protein
VTIFPDQLALRELIAEKERMEAPGSGATEEPCASLAGRASAIQESVWATPARTLVDVLFRAEIAAFQADETMGSLNDEVITTAPWRSRSAPPWTCFARSDKASCYAETSDAGWRPARRCCCGACVPVVAVRRGAAIYGLGRGGGRTFLPRGNP